MAAGGFQWHLDITEYHNPPGPNNLTQVNSFSVGGHPITGDPTADPSHQNLYYHDDQIVSVRQFLLDLNSAFQDAVSRGDTDILYEVTAEARPLIPETSFTAANAIPPAWWEHANDAREIAIIYNIKPVASTVEASQHFGGVTRQLMFQIKFSTGPHGALGTSPAIMDALNTAGMGDIEDVSDGAATPAASVGYTVEAYPIAWEFPYSSGHVAQITDHPPVPPDILFVPFRGVNNKVLVLLDANTGNMYDIPIIINATTDWPLIKEQIISQATDPNAALQVVGQIDAMDDPLQPGLSFGDIPEGLLPEIHYKNDDIARTYEIFRLDSQPSNYGDFSQEYNPIAELTHKVAPNKPSTSANYIDTIKPNVKYYYCARVRDVHGNLSNPTYVYEIEMVDNGGQIYLKQQTIEFATPDIGAWAQPARRLIHIEPAMKQVMFSKDQFMAQQMQGPGFPATEHAPEKNILGAADLASRVWDKSFKVRVTSKKTGKKFDLNITFKNTGVINP